MRPFDTPAPKFEGEDVLFPSPAIPFSEEVARGATPEPEEKGSAFPYLGPLLTSVVTLRWTRGRIRCYSIGDPTSVWNDFPW